MKGRGSQRLEQLQTTLVKNLSPEQSNSISSLIVHWTVVVDMTCSNTEWYRIAYMARAQGKLGVGNLRTTEDR